MTMMRFCPNCETERLLHEIFCEGTVYGSPCGWDLSSEPIRETGWRPQPVITAQDIQKTSGSTTQEQGAHCVNGHPLDEGDFICMVCGADLAESPLSDPQTQEPSGAAMPAFSASGEINAPETTDETVIDGWRILETLSVTDGVRVRYLTEQIETRRRAVLTLYQAGCEPETAVYHVLKQLPRDHVPEIITAGRWNAQAYSIAEELTGGTLSELGIVLHDSGTLKHVVDELGRALHSFSEVGLRHCDLRPETLLVRTRDPLDLVITGFGSARLSEFDLEIISPLQISRYMAPEVIAGGVSVASDWWSLGMILLEQLTQGTCFEGVNDRAFLIQILTYGVTIPDNLDPSAQRLLSGLLAKDHHQRWQWPQVLAWLNGEAVEAPTPVHQQQEAESGIVLNLAGKAYTRPTLFALAAADPLNWQDALLLANRGMLITWLEQIEFASQELIKIRLVLSQQELNEELRLMLILKLINPDMPLIFRGDIVTPHWLLQHPVYGYSLIDGFIPELLKTTEPWLWRLHERAETVNKRAHNLQITLDEESLRIHLLSTSRAQLTVLWQERLALFPDASNVGILSLIERTLLSEEDLIVLLSAELGQFKSVERVIEDTSALCNRAEVSFPESEMLHALIAQPRTALYGTLNQRIEGFAVTGNEQVDKWAEQYRLEKRMPFSRLLLLLSVPEEHWIKPHKQQYISSVIDFFQKKVTTTVLHGPLVRMYLGMYTPRIDIALLGTERRPAEQLLDHILGRNARMQRVDRVNMQAEPSLQRRLSALYRQSTLYRRDTGIDSLYMGYPFLIYQEPSAYRRPRIAPLFLWPVKMQYEASSSGHVAFGFDNDREEIRINPALEGLIGKTLYQGWKSTLDALLMRSALTSQEVMDSLSLLGNILSQQVQALPAGQNVERGEIHFACSAVFFDVNFAGQSIGEELKRLKQLSPMGTGLETALRLKPYQARAELDVLPSESDRYFTVSSDPSQENAVFQSRQEPGLLIEGPPGTGKSQTIVNMVADAIGRGKTVLIVCQKRAALDVVHKRLVAEGLNQRSVMVSDINADRNVIINSIRQQLDSLLKQPRMVAWKTQREQTASRVTQLESTLDSYHHALHFRDEQSGLTYRELIAQLIGFGKGERYFDAPQLRDYLSSLTHEEFTELQNAAGEVRYWLPARYENSALKYLRAFSHDGVATEDFTRFFNHFVQLEQQRADVLTLNKTSFDIQDPEPYQHWLEAESQRFLTLSENARIRLSKWLPLFKSRSNTSGIMTEGHSLILRLQALQENIVSISAEGWCDISVKLYRLTDAELNKLIRQTDMLMMPDPWYRFLSIGRHMAKRHVRRFLNSMGKLSDNTPVADIHAALNLEQQFRPVRQELQQICMQLQLPPLMLSAGKEMQQTVDETLALIEEVSRWSDKIFKAPGSEEVEKAILAGSSFFERLVGDYRSAINRYFVRKASQEGLVFLESYLEPDFYQRSRMAIENNQITPAEIADIHRALPTLAAYQYFRKRAEQLSANTLALLTKLRAYADLLESIAPDQLERCFKWILDHEVRLGWKARLEQRFPALIVSHDETQERIRLLAEADLEMRVLNRVMLEQNIPLETLASAREWEDITRLTGARARRLREFVEQGEKLGLMTLRPVWLMNPDVASRLLPLKAGLFDIVIYDEASQMPVEYALPTLYRGKVVVVSGDEKQMPPSNFFSAQMETEEEDASLQLSYDELEEEEKQEMLSSQWNAKEIMDCPDLLQLARSVLPATGLQIHYRSAFRELIAYSNAAFYGNNLNVPIRHPDAIIDEVKPIEFIQVDGIYEEQSNLMEAQEVVSLVAEIWRLPSEQRPSLGVVTFNKKQADLIEDLFDQRAEKDPLFYETYTEEKQRVEAGENMSVFIKNVENVQGDERDVIVFSTTFGRNQQGVFRRNFGVLGQEGGERRLNVAITRARKKIMLLCSMPIEEISDMLNSQHAPRTPRDYLQCYLSYARSLSAGAFEEAGALLDRVVGSDLARPGYSALTAATDAFADDVADFIQTLGVDYTRGSGRDLFVLDFAIKDPSTGLYIIGIECDAPMNSLLAHARARDIWRTEVLKRAIPYIFRISSHDWYEHNVQVKTRLKREIERALQSGEGETR